MFGQLTFRHGIWAGVTVLVVAFFVAGAALAPFHGDESIWIWMSHDFEDFFIRRDVSKLLYSENPANAEEQSFRYLNNPVPKYLISLSWRFGGYRDADLNGHWVWGADWDWNADQGRIPSDNLLGASRWIPAGFAALAVISVLALGVWLQNDWVGGVAAVLLATDASFLLHARRAMAEGTLMSVGTMAVVLAALYFRRSASDDPLTPRKRRAYVLGIGILTGLTVASKLNGAIIAMTIAVTWVALTALRQQSRDNGQAGDQSDDKKSDRAGVQLWLAEGRDLLVVGLTALAVVWAISPILWLDPPARVRDSFQERYKLVEAQKRGRAWLDTPGERFGALGEQVFWRQRAYYEDAEWAEWVGDQIVRYEASPLSGWRRPPWARVILVGAFLVGLGALVARRPADPAQNTMRWLLLIWLTVTALIKLIILPFDWQRYYLPLWPSVALVEAFGIVAIASAARRWLPRLARPAV